MIIAIIITVLIAIVLGIVLKSWYTKVQKKYTPHEGLPPAFFDDWTGALNVVTQQHTIQQYCHLKGYDYAAPTSPDDYGNCLYTQQTCISDSNPHWVSCSPATGGGGIDPSGKPCDLNQRPYLEWHVNADGVGQCLTSQFPPSFIQQVCEAKGLGSWYQGTPTCDSSGYCQLNPSDLPTCRLTESYCDSMGLDFEDDRGLGDCNLGDVQNVFEGVFGKTVTRTFKKNTEAMINECSADLFSANCALSIGTELTTADQIILNTEVKEFQNYMDNLKSSCTGDIYSDPGSFVTCAANIFPGFFLTEQALSFADGMLNGALGWIPGMPSDLLEKAQGYIFKYGAVAMNAIFKAGSLAVQCFDIADEELTYALNKIGLGAAADLLNGVLRNVFTFGRKMASIIANVVESAINIFVNDIVPEVFHVFSAVVDSLLHPMVFFTNIGNDIAGFFKDPIGGIKNAISEVAKLGSVVLDAAKMVFNKLVDIAGQIGGAIKDALIDIANHIQQVFEDIGNDFKDAADAVGNFFESIF